MRMTASWLDPALGSAEYKDVARDLCAPPWQARLRSSCLCSLKRNATRRAPSLPPCSGRSRSGLETLPHAERLERRPSLTDPLRAAAISAPRVGTRGWAPLGSNKRIGKKVRKKDAVVEN
jgi:hypothetical protein